MRRRADFQVELVEKGSPFCPAALLEEPWASSIPGLWALGNLGILQKPLLGFLCSIRCSGEAILGTYDAVRALREAGVPVIGGFHSPMEKECFELLLKGAQPVVVCLARSIQNLRIPGIWRRPFEEGRLLVLSVFPAEERRMTSELAERRNGLIAAIAEALLVGYAALGSRTEWLGIGVLAAGKELWLPEGCENPQLLKHGAKVCRLSELGEAWSRVRHAGPAGGKR